MEIGSLVAQRVKAIVLGFPISSHARIQQDFPDFADSRE